MTAVSYTHLDVYKRQGLEAGADDYIVKPFHVSLLKARIKNILSLREKMKNLYGESLTLKQLGRCV